MKAIIKRPFKRRFMALLFLLPISGCSGIQSTTVYQSWERQAYNAYNIAAPSAKNMSVLPALLRTVAPPGRQFIRNPSIQRASYQKPAGYSGSAEVSEQELDFIEKNYGL